MTILNTSLLSEPVLAGLRAAGWTGFAGEAGRFATDFLRCAGVPVGRRGRQLLDELGGLTVEVTTKDEYPTPLCPSYPRKQFSLCRALLNFFLITHPEPDLNANRAILPKQLTFRLSFAASGILNSGDSDPTLFLANVPYTFGRVMSVVATEGYDNFLLVDEASAKAYVLSTEMSCVFVFPTFESAL